MTTSTSRGHGTGAVLHVELEGEQGIRSCIDLIRPELDFKSAPTPIRQLHHGVYLPVESVAVVQGVTCPSFHTRRIDIVRQQFNQFTLWEYPPPDEIPVHRQTVPICR